jgi:hypothetical protein
VRWSRILAWTITLLALAAFCVAAVLTEDRVRLIVSSAIGSALWSGAMIFMDNQMGDAAPQPLRLSVSQLPSMASMSKTIVIYAAFIAAFYAWAADLCVSSSYTDVPFGIALGGPFLIWHHVRKAERVERESHGTLWTTTGLAWTAKDRVRYLTPEAADDADADRYTG